MRVKVIRDDLGFDTEEEFEVIEELKAYKIRYRNDPDNPFDDWSIVWDKDCEVVE